MIKPPLNQSLRFILAGIALVAGPVWVTARSGPMTPTRTKVTAASRAEIAPILFGVGVVEAHRNYLVGPTAAGSVKQVHVDAGDVVRAGQPRVATHGNSAQTYRRIEIRAS